MESSKMPLATLDDIVELLKEVPMFAVRTNDYYFKFIFENKSQSLFLYKNKKLYKIANFGSALYAFANQSAFFELVIDNPDKDAHRIYMLYNISVHI